MYLSLILIGLILVSFVEVRYNRDRGGFSFWFFIILFYLMSFLRWERGTDWLSYLSLYENPYFAGDGSYEYTFWGLNILFGSILKIDYTLFLLIEATILYSFIYHGIKSNCKYWVTALFCIYITLGNGGIFFVRQTIAMAIIFYSYKYVVDKNYKYFFLWIGFAACFHVASIVALPVIFIYDLKINKTTVLVCLLSLLLLVVLYRYGFLTRFENKLVGYKEIGNSSSTSIQFYYGIINKLVFLFVFFVFRGKSLEEKGLLKIFVYGLVLYVFFGSLNITLSRLANFVAMFQVYQISRIVERNRMYRRPRYAFLIIVIVLMGLRSLFSVSPYKDLFVPYKSIFNKELKVEVY